MAGSAKRGDCHRLVGKVAIVAGASTGIGRATALRLASEGAKVVVGSPAAEMARIDSLVSEIVAAGGNARGLGFDAANDASVAALVELAVSAFGGIDVFHANFADLRLLAQDTDAASVTDDVLDRTLDIDLKGMLRATRHAIPALLARGGGAMIYTSSVQARTGAPFNPCYQMAKGGLNALVRHVASRWGKEGVRANAIMPGMVVTPENRETMLQEFLDEALGVTRAPRLGEPDDIAAMVAMLASRDGEWITGQAIAVDGGMTLN